MSTTTGLAGQVALVTGASAGVGKAIAIDLAASGVRVGLVARGKDGLDEARQAIISRGGEASSYPADVGALDEVQRAITSIVDTYGGLNIAVYAAGVGLYGPVEKYDPAAWDETLRTNLTGLFHCCRTALPHLKRADGGAIIAIGSGAGKQGYANLAAYSASKFGMLGFMQSLAAEVEPDNIKVSTILPGSILTDFGGKSVEDKRREMAEGRGYLQPSDVANAVNFLLHQSPEAWTQELNLWPK